MDCLIIISGAMLLLTVRLLQEGNVCPCDSSGVNRDLNRLLIITTTANLTKDWRGRVFPNDKLWDGEQCSHGGTCCTGANTLLWFSVSLGNSKVMVLVEVHITGTESTTNEDTPIELLKIYIQ